MNSRKIHTLYNHLLGLAFLLLTAVGCSTEKDALINRAYHNMTARYNGYYNAQVIINDALDEFRNGHQENYETIIPLDLYPNEEEAAALNPPLDDAIERCSKVIVRHSMPNPEAVKNKKEENCRWIDDNWLVIGQAYYIKREYDEAKEKLKYVSDNYKGEEAVYEARIWLAKTHIALGEYSEARRVLVLVKNSIEKSEEPKEKKKRPSKLERERARRAGKKKEKKPAKFPQRLKTDYQIVMAEMYIAEDDYKKAITHLEEGVRLSRNRKEKARYMFALAQLHAEQGNNSQASYYYDKVTSSNAPYEMRFKAKIRQTLTATGGGDELVKELEKMLKDGKNLEYKDQIYYALAELDMKRADKEAAKENYTNSVLWSINNDRQKGTSYLRLADIHFNEKDYLKAQKYYDSSVQALPEDYEGYESLKNKAEGLSDLVINYETVTFEDSVQRIAGMSEKERQKFLENTVKEIKAEEARQKEEAERRLIAQQKRVNNQTTNTGNTSKWYFYNSKQVAAGFNDFRGLWGQRPLEDNWRRTNKSSVAAFVEDGVEIEDSAAVDGLTPEMLAENLPLTPEAIDSSNNRIMNSLYKLGIIYKEQLKEEKEAISYFRQVINRNIEHPKVLPALYQLYLIYDKKGDSQAAGFKSTIINSYPDSEIAQILIDPNYLENKNAKDREELLAYSNILRTYNQRLYGVVITKTNEVIFNDSENKFLNKYYLLKAFALSKINAGNVESISAPLQELYEKSPESEEGKQAKIYLDKLIKGDNITKPDDDVPPVVESPYTFDENSKHFFMIIIPKGKGNANAAKIQLSNFNKEYYRNAGLSLTDAPLGDDTQLVIVRSFASLTKARLYLANYNSTNAAEILGSTPKDYEACLITPTNFATLFSEKDIAAYLEFYTSKY